MPSESDLFFYLNSLAGKSLIFDSLIIFFADYLQFFLVAIFLLLLFFGKLQIKGQLRILLVTTISIIVARLGVTELIRLFYQRPRPFQEYQVHQLVSENEWSFPSWHSAFFFAMATAIFLYNKKWGIGFFIATIFMTVSRIIAGVHYPSDIIGGMIVGIASAYIIFRLSKTAWQKKRQ